MKSIQAGKEEIWQARWWRARIEMHQVEQRGWPVLNTFCSFDVPHCSLNVLNSPVF